MIDSTGLYVYSVNDLTNDWVSFFNLSTSATRDVVTQMRGKLLYTATSHDNMVAVKNQVLGQGVSATPANPLYVLRSDTGQLYSFNGESFRIVSLTNNAVPTGTMQFFAGATAPDGYLLCDGKQYNTSQYPELAKVLGVTGTTSNVPDMRGRVPVGAGANRANTSNRWGTVNAGEVNIPRGEYGGVYQQTLTVDQMPNHKHDVYSTSSKWVSGAGIYASNVGAGSGWEIVSNWASGANYLDTKQVGGGKPFKVMPAYRSDNWIIKW